MANGIMQMQIVPLATADPTQKNMRVALFDNNGAVVIAPKTVAARADDVAITSAAATGGDAPTEAEYNALRIDVVNLRTVVNDLLAKMRTAGILAP